MSIVKFVLSLFVAPVKALPETAHEVHERHARAVKLIVHFLVLVLMVVIIAKWDFEHASMVAAFWGVVITPMIQV